MADIHSIKESISEMPESSAIALLLDIREARRSVMSRRRVKKKSGKKKKSNASKKDMAKTINSMTMEQKLLLLKQLKEE